MNTQHKSALPRLVLATSMFAAIALAIPGAVAAQSNRGTATGDEVVSVSYSDLDLGTANGAKTFAARIANAARRACASNDDALVHNPGEGNTACRRAAIAAAVADLRAPLVDEALGVSPTPMGLATR